MGILAIIFWSSTVAFSRSLTEQLGALTAASYIYLLSGILSFLYLISVPKRIRKLFQLPVLYLVGCGVFFVVYTVCLFLAIGLASSRQQVIKVGIINYMWPGFTLIFSVPILNKKARRSLLPGIIVGSIGVLLINFHDGSFSQEVFWENLRANFLPYMLAFVASISWGFYSNLSRRWAGCTESGAVPIFLLSTGLILTIVRVFFPEEPRLASHMALELLYTAIFPTLLAYIFWDTAMRKGRIILVAALSYFIPVLSTVISCLILKVVVGLHVWIACILVITGAVICRFSIIDETIT